MNRTLPATFLTVLLLTQGGSALAQGSECVILLHGLGRTPLSMLPLKFAVERAGFRTVNHGYPSLAEPIEELAGAHVPAALAECGAAPDEPVHFVTHSLGGILVRYYLQDHELPAGSRMVMLGPPNHGSELIDEFADDPWFSVMGPAALQLGTGPESVPLSLAPVELEIGVIAGTRIGLDWILQEAAPIDGPNDGKVSVESARLEEMTDFLVVDESHTFMLNDTLVMEQVTAFLEHGRFTAVDAPTAAD